MKLKKLVSLMLAGIMVVSMVGCGSAGSGTSAENTDNSGDSDEQEAPAQDSSEDAEAPAQAADSDEEINLTFWHIWPDAEMGAIVETYVEMFEEEHPNVTVESVATQEVEY